MGSPEILNNQTYIFEPKLDGVRALCYVDQELEFVSRNNLDLTQTYPELTIRKNIQVKTAILDGEIVSYDQKKNPSFERLQQGYRATYVVFDILSLNGKSLISLPLLERKKILKRVITKSARIEIIRYTTDGLGLWRKIKTRRLEGVMAKRSDSLYHPGKRTSDWLKIKLLNTIDCVIIGYLPKKRVIGSLAVGVYDKGKLRYIGNVGTGFSATMVKTLHQQLRSIKTNKSSAINADDAPPNLQWVKSRLVCEVEYLMLTQYTMLRAPSFMRLRCDKKPRQCTLTSQIRRAPKPSKRMMGKSK